MLLIGPKWNSARSRCKRSFDALVLCVDHIFILPFVATFSPINVFDPGQKGGFWLDV